MEEREEQEEKIMFHEDWFYPDTTVPEPYDREFTLWPELVVEEIIMD